MKVDAAPWTWRRLKWAWKLARASWFEGNGDFVRALRLLDEAAQYKAPRPSDRVQKARLLLRSQRTSEAHQAFSRLREEFKGSANPNDQYLKRYCTFMLSGFIPSSGQWAYEAKQAQQISCSPSLKRRSPMVTIDEIHEAIPPKP